MEDKPFEGHVVQIHLSRHDSVEKDVEDEADEHGPMARRVGSVPEDSAGFATYAISAGPLAMVARRKKLIFV